MQQRNIILFLILIFIASSVWLFRASDKFTDPDAGKNWWALYFTEPSADALDFTIENHSDETVFHWKVLAENKTIQEENIEIEKGEKKNIKPAADISAGGRIIIEVNLKNEQKEIYKNL